MSKNEFLEKITEIHELLKKNKFTVSVTEYLSNEESELCRELSRNLVECKCLTFNLNTLCPECSVIPPANQSRHSSQCLMCGESDRAVAWRKSHDKLNGFSLDEEDWEWEDDG